jgi:ATP-binding protein involved in chromosome partitioning
VSGAIVVTTPQDVAFADVIRASKMFAIMNVPVLGVIENMASFTCPHCGAETPVFGKGSVEEKAAHMGLEYLGRIPLDGDVSPAADRGAPIVVASPGSPTSQRLGEIARRMAARQSVQNVGPI